LIIIWRSNNAFHYDLRAYDASNETKTSNVYDPAFSRFRLNNSMERHKL